MRGRTWIQEDYLNSWTHFPCVCQKSLGCLGCAAPLPCLSCCRRESIKCPKRKTQVFDFCLWYRKLATTNLGGWFSEITSPLPTRPAPSRRSRAGDWKLSWLSYPASPKRQIKIYFAAEGSFKLKCYFMCPGLTPRYLKTFMDLQTGF